MSDALRIFAVVGIFVVAIALFFGLTCIYDRLDAIAGHLHELTKEKRDDAIQPLPSDTTKRG